MNVFYRPNLPTAPPSVNSGTQVFMSNTMLVYLVLTYYFPTTKAATTNRNSGNGDGKVKKVTIIDNVDKKAEPSEKPGGGGGGGVGNYQPARSRPRYKFMKMKSNKRTNTDIIEYDFDGTKKKPSSHAIPSDMNSGAEPSSSDSGNSNRRRVKRAQSVRRTRRAYRGRDESKEKLFTSYTIFMSSDTFFGLGRTTSGLLFGYFALMYVIYVMSTTILLFSCRNDKSLNKFPLWATHYLPAALNATVVVMSFVKHMFRPKFPCFIQLWTYNLIVPMYVALTFEARSVKLILEYHWNKRMQAVLQASEPSGQFADLALVERLPLPLDVQSISEDQLKQSSDWYWLKKYGVWGMLVLIFVFQFATTMAIQIWSPNYRIWPTPVVYRCAGLIEAIIPLAAFVTYLFAIPVYLFLKLRRINDSYGVRQDIYNSLTQSAWIAVLFTILRHIYFIEQFIGWLPSAFYVMLGFGTLHYHAVMAPLIRVYQWNWQRSGVKKKFNKVYRWKRKMDNILFPRAIRIVVKKAKALKVDDDKNSVNKRSNSNMANSSDNAGAAMEAMHGNIPSSHDLRIPTFIQVLQDDVLCELFERYTLLEFSRENLLFYRAVTNLKTAYTSLLHTGNADLFLADRTRFIYSQFIKSAAPAEINIPGPIRKSIESRLEEDWIDQGIFDEAQREVFKLMQSWSFPRFLRTLPEEEVRKFNRKQRRNSLAIAEDVMAAAMALGNTSLDEDTVGSAVNIYGNNTVWRPSETSISTSLLMPAFIAQVHLSSSP